MFDIEKAVHRDILDYYVYNILNFKGNYVPIMFIYQYSYNHQLSFMNYLIMILNVLASKHFYVNAWLMKEDLTEVTRLNM